MLILVCETCRGSGTAVPGSKPCETCNGSGHPPGYKPPTAEECRRYAFPNSKLLPENQHE